MFGCETTRPAAAGWAGTLWPAPGMVPPPGPASFVPRLHRFNVVVLRISGGKDSQAMMRQAWRTAIEQGYPLDRIVVEYDDLGDVVWPGTAEISDDLVQRFGDRPGSKELARLQAQAYGFRFEVRQQKARTVNVTLPDGTQGTRPASLLEDIRTRTGKDGRHRWPDSKNRYCTSDHKRAPGRALLTELVREMGGVKKLGRPARVLTVMGFRAQESSDRGKRRVFCYDRSASGKGCVRRVWLWLPIHHWTVQQVWADIHESGVQYAWPYDAGLSRFSCALCVLGSRSDAVLSAQLWPANALRYAADEQQMGHTFQRDWSMANTLAAAGLTITN